MPKSFSKRDAHTLRVTTTSDPTSVTITDYPYEFLLEQRDRIRQSRDAELQEVENLIAEADKLGLVLDPDMMNGTSL